MKFQQVNDVFGVVDPTQIRFTDETGEVWIVPEGHRFWTTYEQWLSEGNTPLAANQ